MKRTRLSIAGGILLLLLSLCTGFGGLGYLVLSFPENLAETIRQNRAELARMRGEAGPLRPDQKRQFDRVEEMLTKLESRTSGPEGEAWLRRWRPFGVFEVLAAALGLVGGVGLLVGGRFGRRWGLPAGLAGAASCIWGSMIGLPPLAGVGFQIAFLLLYVSTILGALSIPQEASAQ